MRIAIVCGSHRPSSESARVGAHLADVLRGRWDDAVTLRDLGAAPLPLWDEGVWRGDDRWREALAPVLAELEAADALVLVTPEWGGMATPAIKNFLLFCPASAVGHKPALAVAVSHSRGGAPPIAELRMSASKNNRLCFIPEHLIVRDVAELFAGPEAATEDDAYMRGRAVYALGLLREYGRALRGVRASGAVDHAAFPHGM